jgi:phosphoribosylformylglycinamidine synthase II
MNLTSQAQVGLRLAVEHGLSEEEYQRILRLLGRAPTYTELGIYSVMWSEHCSYKNSLALLRLLPRRGDVLLAEAGEENAGLVDIGDGLAIAFKIESHNHPSAVEPFQGAATGVGGILRDIFTMGARPIAVLDSLRFGPLEHERSRYLLSEVIRGISRYGNSFGVPTVGGEVYFDLSFSSNPIVNVMAIGVVETGRIIHAAARGVGNPVLIVGSSTGRDGIHGATFASEQISATSEARRPAVQVGDPFTEKCLLEALLEAHRANCLVAVQDMGAAGITCSTTEMSVRGNSGMDIDLDLVPMREPGMSCYEIALSESQERMLVVSTPEKVDELKSIFLKWDLHAVQIGRVVEGDMVRYRMGGEVYAEIPAASVVAGYGAPVYQRESRVPSYLAETSAFDPSRIPYPEELEGPFLRLLGSPNVASKNWIFEQYDNAVMTGTVVGPGMDAAVLRIPGSRKLLAATTDCNSRYVYLDPRIGAKIAVAEAARNLVCIGARPLAVTNCLNFGSPYDPEVYWQFKETVLGIAEACERLETPVTGGNVSFHNENPDGAILPTPVIGMIGVIERESYVVTPYFKSAGDKILLLGVTRGGIGGSEYLYQSCGLVTGQPPSVNMSQEVALQSALLEAIRGGLIKSAHDLSEGGLAVALAECCIADLTQPLGARVNWNLTARPDFLLFGEDQSRILVTCDDVNLSELLSLLSKWNVPSQVIGIVGGSSLQIGNYIDIPTEILVQTYYESIRNRVSKSGSR